MVVGEGSPSAVFATCTTTPSCKFVLSPTDMLFTSPAYQTGRYYLTASHWRAFGQGWGRKPSTHAHGNAGVRPCVRERHPPLRTALYHTDDLSPSFTLPMTDAVGATKTTSPSCGFAPSYGSTGLCRDTARHTGCQSAPCAWWIGGMGKRASGWGVWIGTHVRS